ncbi:C2 domain [Dillenia turbinata]|uniref:C2 domain n=1 Tax=Dillenia turbinata TaxID=194707 RepID=A0AAN8ZKZ9_9MAGN
MGKIRIEVCIISARGLRHASSLWKPQWFAVGWIDPNAKYCTKIDAPGNAIPVWKTKFSTLVENSDGFEDLALNVEVHSREPIFLREKLHGKACVTLKEFLAKSSENGKEDVGSFQLRKGNSSKPQGFVDISIKILEEQEITSAFSDYKNGITMPTYTRPQPQPQPSNPNHMPFFPTTNQFNPSTSMQLHPSYPTTSGIGPSHPPPGTPPPPPPPSNVGYAPTILPRAGQLPETYINLPSSGVPQGQRERNISGFTMGLGAGALTAGAMIFGDDFMSGFELPTTDI